MQKITIQIWTLTLDVQKQTMHVIRSSTRLDH
jgi:hypothetical protein